MMVDLSPDVYGAGRMTQPHRTCSHSLIWHENNTQSSITVFKATVSSQVRVAGNNRTTIYSTIKHYSFLSRRVYGRVYVSFFLGLFGFHRSIKVHSDLYLKTFPLSSSWKVQYYTLVPYIYTTNYYIFVFLYADVSSSIYILTLYNSGFCLHS